MSERILWALAISERNKQHWVAPCDKVTFHVRSEHDNRSWRSCWLEIVTGSGDSIAFDCASVKAGKMAAEKFLEAIEALEKANE